MDKGVANACLNAHELVSSRPTLSEAALIRVEHFIGFKEM